MEKEIQRAYAQHIGIKSRDPGRLKPAFRYSDFSVTLVTYLFTGLLLSDATDQWTRFRNFQQFLAGREMSETKAHATISVTVSRHQPKVWQAMPHFWLVSAVGPPCRPTMSLSVSKMTTHRPTMTGSVARA